jgi:hypothetical protein
MKLTKAWLRKECACSDGIEWFGKCGETDLLKVGLKAIDNDRGDYSRWLIEHTLRTKKKIAVQVAIYAAEQVIDIFEAKYPEDKRPRDAIKAAKKYLKNPSKENKDAAANAANAAYAAAYAAANAAAYAAAYAAANAAAYAAANAAANAAYAAYAAANAANAANAAYAANAAAYAAANAAYAAYAAANAAARKEMQIKIYTKFIKLLEAK